MAICVEAAIRRVEACGGRVDMLSLQSRSGGMSNERLTRQIAFLVEADRLKGIVRRTPLSDNSRLENSAEHSWHLALAAMALAEHAPGGVDTAHVVALVIVHDLVEIDAGDTFAYDAAGNDTKAERERTAADRIFGVLPRDQGQRFRELWEEFEAMMTPASRVANALDRLQALLQNMAAGGGAGPCTTSRAGRCSSAWRRSRRRCRRSGPSCGT